MKSVLLYCLFFVGLTLSLSAQSWGKHLTSAGTHNSGQKTITDKLSNVYVFENSRTGNSQHSCTVIKYDSVGVLIWKKILDGFTVTSAEITFSKITVAGQLTGVLTINGTNFYGNGNTSLLLNFDPQGNYTWAKSVGDAQVYSLKADHSSIYLCGTFQGTCAFDNHTLSQSFYGQRDFFIAKCGSVGTFHWATKGKGGIIGTKGDLAIIGSHVYVTAHYILPIEFGSGSTSQTLTTDGTSIFLANFDNSGQFKWAKKISHSGECEARSINTDQNGNIYIGGWYSMKATFSDVTLSCSYRNGFIAKYDALGNQQWVKQGDNYSGYICDFFVSDNIYSVGSFEKSGAYNYGIVFDLNGNERYSLNYTGSSEYYQIVANDTSIHNGNISVTGDFFGDVKCGYIEFSKPFAGPHREAFMLFFSNQKKIESVKEAGYSEAYFSIIPNPNNGTFIVKRNQEYSGPTSVLVIDELGRVILDFSNSFDSYDQLQIDLRTQGKGLYLVKITNAACSMISKVICN